MPYFDWQGITLQGTIKKGRMFAHAEQDIHDRLFKRDIALLTIKKSRPSLFVARIGTNHITNFLRHLSLLLKAGILLPDALMSIQEHTAHDALHTVIGSLSAQIQAGIPLDRAMAEHKTIFDHLIIQLVAVGQETGKLAVLLDMITHYLEIKHHFHKQLRSLAFMPIITFGFFIGISALILFGIIPRFIILFSSFNHQLPLLTQSIISMSIWCYSWYGVFSIGALIGSIYACYKYGKSTSGKPKIDYFLLKAPYIKDFVIQKNCMFFIRALSVLLASGIPMTKALSLARQSISNTVLYEKMVFLEQAVQSGESLTISFLQHPDQFFSSDCIALIKMGELAGNLPQMLEQSALHYQNNLQEKFTIITKLFQPLLIIILGLLITVLIFAVYLPILEFSHMIH